LAARYPLFHLSRSGPLDHQHSPNAIEVLNAKLRRAVRTRGHLPNDDVAVRLSYLVLNHAAEERKRSSREWVQGLCHGNLILLANLIFCKQVSQAKSSTWDAGSRAQICGYDPLHGSTLQVIATYSLPIGEGNNTAQNALFVLAAERLAA
jgi:hypothetical protein